MIYVSLHHTGLAKGRVRSAYHVPGDVFSVLTAGFDFDHATVKILQIVVHLFEIGSACLLALYRRTMSGEELLIVAFKERPQGR